MAFGLRFFQPDLAAPGASVCGSLVDDGALVVVAAHRSAVERAHHLDHCFLSKLLRMLSAST